MSTNWIQGFGEDIHRQWGAESGAVRDQMLQTKQRELSTLDHLSTGLRDKPMVAASNNTQFIQDDSVKYINHFDQQEATGHQVGSLMLNAVDTTSAALGGVTA